jgi:probable phosphoglycerate mutase
MNQVLPITYLARHGETEWTVTGQHTGLTDLSLTPRGECNARQLGQRLAGLSFAKVYTSPLQRARQTCELAGFGALAEVDADLVEWDYGVYEGLTSAEILAQRPDWRLFRDGCPRGETPQQVAARADRVVHRIREADGDVLIFSSAHFLRMLATRWIGADAVTGGALMLGTASLSALSYERDVSQPAIWLWNDVHHVLAECRDERFPTHSSIAAPGPKLHAATRRSRRTPLNLLLESAI